LIIAAALIAAVYFWSPHANLRVTIGPPGSAAYRFITAFASVTEATHPRVRVKLVPVADLAASAKAIEVHATDLGIVRSDAVIPSNGATIVILRRMSSLSSCRQNPRSTRSQTSPARPSASRKVPCKLTTSRPSIRS
jgi:hypothetical protein